MSSANLPLNVKNVKKSFGSKKVLDGITFSVKQKEIFGLIGLNGIGKTTLIKIILDLLDKDSGTVEMFGKSSLLKESRKNLAYLPEKFQPCSFLKGKEFLSLFSGDLKDKFWKDEKEKRKVDKAARLLSLETSALNRKVSEYSKGMIQKLGLMSAFLSNSGVFVSSP